MLKLRSPVSFFSLKGKMGILFVTTIALALSTVLIPANAYGASVYDDIIKITTDLEIETSDGSASRDFATDWLVNATETLSNFCDDLGGAYCTNLASLEASVGAVDSQWAVSKATSDGVDFEYLTIYWCTYSSPDCFGDFNNTTYPGTPTFFLRSSSLKMNVATFTYNPANAMASSDGLLYVTGQFGFGAQPVQDSPYDPVFLFINYPITYPSDYEGEIPPDSYTPEDTSTIGLGYSPSFSYTVTDLDIEVQDTTNPLKLEQYKIDLCFFQLPNNRYGDNFAQYEYDCESPPPIEHTFSDGYASYKILLRHYSSENDKYYDNTRILDVDGSTFSGNVGGESVDNGILDALSGFEFPLFGLQEIFLIPINFIATLPSKVDACAPIELPLLDTNYEMDCLLPYYQLQFGGIVTIYQTIFTGLTTYFIAQKVLSRIKSTTNPKDDSIEVVQL